MATVENTTLSPGTRTEGGGLPATVGNAHVVSDRPRHAMTKTARVYKIEMLIRNRGHVSFQTLLVSMSSDRDGPTPVFDQVA